MAPPHHPSSSAPRLALKAKAFKPRPNERVFTFDLRRHNGGVDAAARIKAPFAAPSKLRKTPPPLASNDLLGGVDEHL
jgi:hypothetical protein